jgi:hypothetical protein
MRQTPVRNLLFASALAVGLLAAFPSASSSGPTTQVNVGGIDFKANDSGGSFTSGKIRDRSQPVNTGTTSTDQSSRSQGGKSVPGITTPTTGSTTNGTLQGEEYGKPASTLCSTTSITIGEEHRTTLHCPGGTLR